MTRNLQRAAVLCSPLLLSLGAMEAAIRILGLAPLTIALDIDTPTGSFMRVDNPDLKFVPKPRTNDIISYGIRERVYPLQKPPGTYRIIVVGDSVTYGMCNQNTLIPLDQTFVKRMEAELNDAPRPGVEHVEVIDLGVPGYDTLNESAF